MKQTKKQNTIWFSVALIATILHAPNTTLLKHAIAEIGPVWIGLLRFVLLGLILLPVVYMGRRGINQKSFKYAILAGLAYSTAVISLLGAVAFSQVSYPAIISISSPIILMLLSVFLTRERVKKSSFFGITVAAIGGFVIIAVPVMLGGGLGGSISPVATFLAVLNAIASPLMYVMTKKSVDAGLSVWASMGIVAWVGVFILAAGSMFLNLQLPAVSTVLQPGVILPIIYAAVFVMLLARAMTTSAYKHLGSASIAALEYLGVFLAVAIPVVFLGEQLSLEMLLGGALILMGVIAIELKYTPNWWNGARRSFRVLASSVGLW